MIITQKAWFEWTCIICAFGGAVLLIYFELLPEINDAILRLL